MYTLRKKKKVNLVLVRVSHPNIIFVFFMEGVQLKKIDVF